MTPETMVRLLSNVPFSLSQTHVRDFQTLSEQSSYFIGKTRHIFTNFTYQREERAIKVPINVDALYDINYLMYQNSNHSNKWFYGFVTRKEYVNPNTTAIYFEVDVYQTWLFDFELKRSYVIREHATRWNADGTPVINTIEENLNIGTEYETVSVERYHPFDDVFFLVIVTKSAMHVGAENKISPNINGYPQPLNYYIHPFRLDGTMPGNNLGTLSTPLEVLEGLFTQTTAVDNVVSLYITDYFDNLAFTDGTLSFSTTDFERVSVSDDTAININTIHVKNLRWYRSKLADFGNKYDGFSTMSESKLYMYPYTVTILDDFKGNRIEIKNEYINSTNLQVRIKGSLGTSNKVAYQVENYSVSDEVLGNQEIGLEQSVINNNPNDIPVLADLLSAYLQGNRNTIENQKSAILWNGFQSVFHGAVGGAVGFGGRGGIVGAVAGAGTGAINSYFQIEGLNAKQRDIINQPPNLTRMGGNTNFDYGNGINGLFIIKKQITKEYRDRIGDYFKMFGYKVNTLKIPNLRSRRDFNFIHTADVHISGNIPQDDKEKIRDIFNSGVTIWHGDFVGDYSKENPEV